MLCLPVPPSTNALYRNVAHGRVKTAEYNHWIAEANAVCIQQKKAVNAMALTEGAYRVVIRLPGSCKMDIDNALKALLDFLVTRAITPDDSNCRRLEIEKLDEVSDFCEVEVLPYVGKTA